MASAIASSPTVEYPLAHRIAPLTPDIFARANALPPGLVNVVVPMIIVGEPNNSEINTLPSLSVVIARLESP